MSQVGVQKVGEIRRRYARGKAATVIRERFVVIACNDADLLRRRDDQLENPQQHFEPESLVIDEIAEKNDAPRSAVGGLRMSTYLRQRRLERQQIAMQIADDPRWGCRVHRGHTDRAQVSARAPSEAV